MGNLQELRVRRKRYFSPRKTLKARKEKRQISKYLREAQTFVDHVFILFILYIPVKLVRTVHPQDRFIKFIKIALICAALTHFFFALDY